MLRVPAAASCTSRPAAYAQCKPPHPGHGASVRARFLDYLTADELAPLSASPPASPAHLAGQGLLVGAPAHRRTADRVAGGL